MKSLGGVFSRMRIVGAVLMLAACTFASRGSVASTLAPDAAFTCALQQVTRLGYSVTMSERAGGLLRAERQTAGSFTQLMGGQNFDELNITTLPGAGAGSDLTITATSTTQAAGRARQAMALTESAKASADTVRARCAGAGTTTSP